MIISQYELRLKDQQPYLVKENTVRGEGSLQNPQKIYEFMCQNYHLSEMAEEHSYMIAQNANCVPVGIFFMSKGTATNTLLNPREIYIRLLLSGATGFVLVHNHPSGNVTPSRDDMLCTERIKKVGDMIGIQLLDHIIVGNGFCSFQEKGIL